MSIRKKSILAMKEISDKKEWSQLDEIEDLVFTQDNTEEIYKMHIYQIIGDFLSGHSSEDIITRIKQEKLGWKHPTYTEIRNKINEQDNFIENPFKVEEGVLECYKILKTGKKCGSKRVLYYQKQTRGADEPMTTFATCYECGHKWRYDG